MLTRTLLAALACCAAVQAQGLPDCLLGDQYGDTATDQRCSLIRRLVDRDQNGIWDNGAALGQNEVFDYYRSSANTSFRDVIQSPWSASDYYVVDGELTGTALPAPGRILRLNDANGDGVIQSGEAHVAFDPLAFWGQNDNEMEAMATDGIAIYFISNAGNYEGVWRCFDLNNDGDFMDNVAGVDETTPALVELAGDPVNGSYTHPVYNTPNTEAALAITPGSGSPYYDPSETQRMSFVPRSDNDPTSLALGLFLIEDEENDQTFALEDRNGDGDFYDQDELFMWHGGNANQNTNNPMWRDASPDVPVNSATVPDPGNYVADTTSIPGTPIYYFLDQTSGSDSRGCAIHRAIDTNADGDVNDAGEVTYFWFQARNNDPDLPCEFLEYIDVWQGDVFVQGDLINSTGQGWDAIIRLSDTSGDGMIQNASEATVVWRSPTDSQSTKITLFAPGQLGPAPAALPCMTEAIDSATCAPSNVPTTVHTLSLGRVNPFDELPILGQPMTWNTGLSGLVDATTLNPIGSGPFNANAALHIGFPLGAPFPLDGAATCNLIVNPIVVVPTPLDANGWNLFTFTIPFSASAVGTSLYFQSLAIDLAINPFNVTTSNTIRAQLGTADFTHTIAWRPERGEY